LLSSRHARPERGVRRRCRFTLRSPQQPFGSPWLIAPGDSQHAFLTGPVSRGDLSLPYGDCPFPDLLHRLSVSGLPLRNLTGPVSGSFGFGLPSSASGFPDRGGSSPKTRLLHLCPAIPAAPLALLPFGTFRSLRINARLGLPPGSPPSRNVRSPFAPHRQSFLVLPAAHRSRLASFLVAHCSVNLLEPLPVSLGFTDVSNQKPRREPLSQRFFPLYLQQDRGREDRNSCA